MTIHLTPEQERRIQAVLTRGAYESVDEVVEAALTALEQRQAPGCAGTREELDTLLAEGLASKQLAEDEFWDSVGKHTDALLDLRPFGVDLPRPRESARRLTALAQDVLQNSAVLVVGDFKGRIDSRQRGENFLLAVRIARA